MPRANFEKKNKKFCTQNVFLGIFDATSPYKNLVKKNWENELFPTCDSEANFPAAMQFLKAGAMGVVLAVSSFWQFKAHPATR